MSSPPTIDRVLALCEAQELLFAPRPARLALTQAELPTDPQAPARRIRVWRNHAFEPLIELMTPYLRFGRWTADFDIGDYDDSLMFAELPTLRPPDLHLLWLDNTRLLSKLALADWLDWLSGRVRALRQADAAPILIATWLAPEQEAQARERLLAQPGVQLANLQPLCEQAGVPLLDARNASWAGSPLSRLAQLQAARALACHWLPALLLPPLKAIALDLDHTLYRGVLGEDGVRGVELSDAHRALQQRLLQWRERGIFLALVSRNEAVDVRQLFDERQDFPLRWAHFSATEIGWGDKSEALARIAQQLRIGLDAMVYVDDNAGELAQVASHHPQIRTLWAHADAAQTQAALDLCPALWRWAVSDDDRKRVQDAQAQAERAALQGQGEPDAEYYRSLQVSLELRLDPAADLQRLADLCVKTNQFNLAMRRFNGAELQQHLQAPDSAVVSVRLADRLSDSGTIAVLVAQRNGPALDVLELCISCRALGRRLEDSIVALALQQMPQLADCESVRFRVEHGPRNQPAREWLARWLGQAPEPGWHAVPAERLRAHRAPDGVTLLAPALPATSTVSATCQDPLHELPSSS